MVRDVDLFYSPKDCPHVQRCGGHSAGWERSVLHTAGRICAGDNHSLRGATCSAAILKDTRHQTSVPFLQETSRQRETIKIITPIMTRLLELILRDYRYSEIACIPLKAENTG